MVQVKGVDFDFPDIFGLFFQVSLRGKNHDAKHPENLSTVSERLEILDFRGVSVQFIDFFIRR